MSSRLVTLATFDLPFKADLAKAALEEVGIHAVVTDREIVAMDYLLAPAVGGIKLLVPEADVERALAVVEPFTRPGAVEQPIDDEELERQALAAPTEDEELAAAAQVPTATEVPLDTHTDREKHATRAFWCLLAGVVCLPAWAVGMYSLLNATFDSGPLSSNGRFNLRVAWMLGAITTVLMVLMMTRTLANPVP